MKRLFTEHLPTAARLQFSQTGLVPLPGYKLGSKEYTIAGKKQSFARVLHKFQVGNVVTLFGDPRPVRVFYVVLGFTTGDEVRVTPLDNLFDFTANNEVTFTSLNAETMFEPARLVWEQHMERKLKTVMWRFNELSIGMLVAPRSFGRSKPRMVCEVTAKDAVKFEITVRPMRGLTRKESHIPLVWNPVDLIPLKFFGEEWLKENESARARLLNDNVLFEKDELVDFKTAAMYLHRDLGSENNKEHEWYDESRKDVVILKSVGPMSVGDLIKSRRKRTGGLNDESRILGDDEDMQVPLGGKCHLTLNGRSYDDAVILKYNEMSRMYEVSYDWKEDGSGKTVSYKKSELKNAVVPRFDPGDEVAFKSFTGRVFDATVFAFKEMEDVPMLTLRPIETKDPLIELRGDHPRIVRHFGLNDVVRLVRINEDDYDVSDVAVFYTGKITEIFRNGLTDEQYTNVMIHPDGRTTVTRSNNPLRTLDDNIPLREVCFKVEVKLPDGSVRVHRVLEGNMYTLRRVFSTGATVTVCDERDVSKSRDYSVSFIRKTSEKAYVVHYQNAFGVQFVHELRAASLWPSTRKMHLLTGTVMESATPVSRVIEQNGVSEYYTKRRMASRPYVPVNCSQMKQKQFPTGQMKTKYSQARKVVPFRQFEYEPAIYASNVSDVQRTASLLLRNKKVALAKLAVVGKRFQPDVALGFVPSVAYVKNNSTVVVGSMEQDYQAYVEEKKKRAEAKYPYAQWLVDAFIARNKTFHEYMDEKNTQSEKLTEMKNSILVELSHLYCEGLEMTGFLKQFIDKHLSESKEPLTSIVKKRADMLDDLLIRLMQTSTSMKNANQWFRIKTSDVDGMSYEDKAYYYLSITATLELFKTRMTMSDFDILYSTPEVAPPPPSVTTTTTTTTPSVEIITETGFGDSDVTMTGVDDTEYVQVFLYTNPAKYLEVAETKPGSFLVDPRLLDADIPDKVSSDMVLKWSNPSKLAVKPGVNFPLRSRMFERKMARVDFEQMIKRPEYVDLKLCMTDVSLRKALEAMDETRRHVVYRIRGGVTDVPNMMSRTALLGYRNISGGQYWVWSRTSVLDRQMAYLEFVRMLAEESEFVDITLTSSLTVYRWSYMEEKQLHEANKVVKNPPFRVFFYVNPDVDVVGSTVTAVQLQSWRLRAYRTSLPRSYAIIKTKISRVEFESMVFANELMKTIVLYTSMGTLKNNLAELSLIPSAPEDLPVEHFLVSPSVTTQPGPRITGNVLFDLTDESRFPRPRGVLDSILNSPAPVEYSTKISKAEWAAYEALRGTYVHLELYTSPRAYRNAVHAQRSIPENKRARTPCLINPKTEACPDTLTSEQYVQLRDPSRWENEGSAWTTSRVFIAKILKTEMAKAVAEMDKYVYLRLYLHEVDYADAIRKKDLEHINGRRPSVFLINPNTESVPETITSTALTELMSTQRWVEMRDKNKRGVRMFVSKILLTDFANVVLPEAVQPEEQTASPSVVQAAAENQRNISAGSPPVAISGDMYLTMALYTSHEARKKVLSDRRKEMHLDDGLRQTRVDPVSIVIGSGVTGVPTTLSADQLAALKRDDIGYDRIKFVKTLVAPSVFETHMLYSEFAKQRVFRGETVQLPTMISLKREAMAMLYDAKSVNEDAKFDEDMDIAEEMPGKSGVRAVEATRAAALAQRQARLVRLVEKKYKNDSKYGLFGSALDDFVNALSEKIADELHVHSRPAREPGYLKWSGYDTEFDNLFYMQEEVIPGVMTYPPTMPVVGLRSQTSVEYLKAAHDPFYRIRVITRLLNEYTQHYNEFVSVVEDSAEFYKLEPWYQDYVKKVENQLSMDNDTGSGMMMWTVDAAGNIVKVAAAITVASMVGSMAMNALSSAPLANQVTPMMNPYSYMPPVPPVSLPSSAPSSSYPGFLVFAASAAVNAASGATEAILDVKRRRRALEAHPKMLEMENDIARMVERSDASARVVYSGIVSDLKGLIESLKEKTRKFRIQFSRAVNVERMLDVRFRGDTVDFVNAAFKFKSQLLMRHGQVFGDLIHYAFTVRTKSELFRMFRTSKWSVSLLNPLRAAVDAVVNNASVPLRMEEGNLVDSYYVNQARASNMASLAVASVVNIADNLTSFQWFGSMRIANQIFSTFSFELSKQEWMDVRHELFGRAVAYKSGGDLDLFDHVMRRALYL
jgi:hypothetical protein